MTDIIETYHYDEQEDKMHIQRVQDVEPILEANKRQFQVDDKRYKSDTLNHVARIPLVLLEQWGKKLGMNPMHILEDDKLLRKLLDDPDHRFLRTKPGKLSR